MEIFVIMPFSKTTENHSEGYWTDFYRHLESALRDRLGDYVRETLKWDSFSVRRINAPPGNIIDYIVRDLIQADLVVAVLSDLNPNVFYELGMRHSLVKGRTIMLIEKGQPIPFYFKNFGVVEYSDGGNLEQQFEQSIKEHIACLVQNPAKSDNPVADFYAKGGQEQFGERHGIRIKIVDSMPTEKHEWLPYFYREQDRDKQPLPSTVIAFVVEILNRGSRRVAVDNARLHVTIGKESFHTDELFEEGWVISGGMSRGLNLNHLRHISLAPGVPQILRIAFRLRGTVSDDLKTITTHLELTDSDNSRHTSEPFCVYEYPGYLLTRQVADQLYGRQSEDQ